MCGAEAEAAHLARQRSVSVAAVVGVQSGRVVVLSVPGSVPVPVAVAVVVVSGVSVIQVGRLGSLRGLGLGGVRRFTAVTTVSAGDGAEILVRRKKDENGGKVRKRSIMDVTGEI